MAVFCLRHAVVSPVWPYLARGSLRYKGIGMVGDIANKDLWEEVWELRQSTQQWSFDLSWINSHDDCIDTIAPNIQGECYRGNDAADHWAKDTATHHQVDKFYTDRLDQAHSN